MDAITMTPAEVFDWAFNVSCNLAPVHQAITCEVSKNTENEMFVNVFLWDIDLEGYAGRSRELFHGTLKDFTWWVSCWK